MATITRDQLIVKLASLRGSQIVTLTTETDARLRKTHPTLKVGGKAARSPYADDSVTKVSRVNVVINFTYQNAVNRQQCREGNAGDFVAQPRQWGERVEGTPFVQHKGRLYVECKVERVVGETEFRVNGLPIDRSEIADYLPASRSSAEHQGVDREIVLRDYALDSILAVTMGGETFEVVADAGQLAMAGC